MFAAEGRLGLAKVDVLSDRGLALTNAFGATRKANATKAIFAIFFIAPPILFKARTTLFPAASQTRLQAQKRVRMAVGLLREECFH